MVQAVRRYHFANLAEVSEVVSEIRLKTDAIEGSRVVSALDLYVDPDTGDDLNDGFTPANAKQTAGSVSELLRGLTLADGVILTVTFADGVYRDEDAFSTADKAWLHLSNIKLEGSSRIVLQGNVGDPTQVEIRGDDAGSPGVKVRKHGILVDVVGSGRVEAKGFEFQEFDVAGVLSAFNANYGELLLESVNAISNRTGIVSSSRVGRVTMTDVIGDNNLNEGHVITNASGVAVSGSSQFKNNGADGGLWRNVGDSSLTNTNNLVDIEFSGNVGYGLRCVACTNVEIVAIASVSDTKIRMESNGKDGLFLDGGSRAIVEEISGSGTAHVIINTNTTAGIRVKYSQLDLNIASTLNSVASPQALGIVADYGGSIKILGTNPIRGTVDNEAAEGDGFYTGLSVGGGGPSTTGFLSRSNKDMTASATASDGALATVIPIAATPFADGFVHVFVNGAMVAVGDGVKTKNCYFSGDGGTTARFVADIVAGDTLHWNGSIAGYQLDTADRIDFLYQID